MAERGRDTGTPLAAAQKAFAEARRNQPTDGSEALSPLEAAIQAAEAIFMERLLSDECLEGPAHRLYARHARSPVHWKGFDPKDVQSIDGYWVDLHPQRKQYWRKEAREYVEAALTTTQDTESGEER